ncbi:MULTISPECIES: DsbC family protein [Lysobacter]|jgi:thiol:disulfide interchange protein DsbC|uniref:DsbC family protein n=1 Tax=Lysobacter TaxID=68 RepID=UPI001F43BB0F|nr:MULTISPECIES: DsbC family protein [Lysobacter]UJB20164.1 DsbC family protein [Lysobacter capsici]UJQ30721.1 DsbC family protein [Lysobacter gummosus]
MKRIMFAVLGAISLSACAQAPQAAAAKTDPVKPAAAAAAEAPKGAAPKVAAGSADARAVDAIRTLSPNINIDKVGAAPMPGFREALAQGQVVYVSDDGRYLFLPGSGGALFDTQAKRNLSEDTLAGMRKDLVKSIPVSERIVFSPPNPKHTVAVFTDVECGYCRKLHSEIAEYNRQGIAVEYLAFPRAGIGSEDYKKMVSVWCAADRRKALTEAKSDQGVAAKECKNTIEQQYNIGQRAGLTGTPMILNSEGVQLGGYVPPAQLRQALDKLAAESKTAAKPTAAVATPVGGL